MNRCTHPSGEHNCIRVKRFPLIATRWRWVCVRCQRWFTEDTR